MTKKEKIQKLFEESGLTDQLMQLIMSGALPIFAIDDSLGEEVKTKKYSIILRYALKAATDLYSDLLTVREVDELISIYRRPVMKKVSGSQSSTVEAVDCYNDNPQLFLNTNHISDILVINKTNINIKNKYHVTSY